jgi:hypothetical protein
MIFRLRGKEVDGESAIQIVRRLEQDEKDYTSCGGPIRQYLLWSLNQLIWSVPPRDVDLSDRLDDETLALGYLLLLDEYGIGELKMKSDRQAE